MRLLGRDLTKTTAKLVEDPERVDLERPLEIRHKKVAWPGGPGRLSSRGSHRPVRAFLMHTVPQVMDLLRDSILSGPPAPAGAGTALTAG